MAVTPMQSEFPLRFFLVLCTSLLLAACATTANVDYRPGYDFTSVHTVQISVPGNTSSDDPRVNSPLVRDRILAAISAHLVAHGYQVVNSTGDVQLTWQLITRSGVESYGSSVSFGFGTFGRRSALGLGYGFPAYDVDSYDDVVLTIDIQEPATGALLWRGSASHRLGDGNTPEKLNELVNALVSDVLGQFPPGQPR